MRMKARPGLHYAPVPGGVYLAGASTQFVMRGWDLLFTVADVCVPLLEDGATEDDLVAALGSEHARPAVRHLTEGLRTHGLLLEPGRLTMPEPPATVREQHAESLALLESVCADPYAAFAALRGATVALAGPPEATGPAARGLIRAGAGRVVVAGTAGEDMPEDADAMLVCVGAGDEPAPPEPYGRPAMIVPVVLDDRLLLAGPVIRDGTSLRTWSAFRARALAWTDPAVAPPRPVADALAGALAAQLLFETLTGVAGEGDAHVVYGADLAAKRITVRGADAQPRVWRRLGDSEPAPVPGVEEAVDLAGTVTAPWTGLVALAPGDSLPQMPLALREARYGSARPGSVVAWGADQESATVAATLAALRQSAGAPLTATAQAATAQAATAQAETAGTLPAPPGSPRMPGCSTVRSGCSPTARCRCTRCQWTAWSRRRCGSGGRSSGPSPDSTPSRCGTCRASAGCSAGSGPRAPGRRSAWPGARMRTPRSSARSAPRWPGLRCGR